MEINPPQDRNALLAKCALDDRKYPYFHLGGLKPRIFFSAEMQAERPAPPKLERLRRKLL
jgi:hypothetical protein